MKTEKKNEYMTLRLLNEKEEEETNEDKRRERRRRQCRKELKMGKEASFKALSHDICTLGTVMLSAGGRNQIWRITIIHRRKRG